MFLKIVGLCIIALCCVSCVKVIMPSIAVLVSCGFAVIILTLCLEQSGGFIGYYFELCTSGEYGDYFKVMLKGLGVALLSEAGADLCRDAGESTLASRIELAGKVEILCIALPLIKSLVSLSERILIE
ncbi:MAG: hypothetical protein E7652_09255 [Ruminococcaceae bacterium]|nr:hypothetical protein [Oscillospiraceae bacterium]